MQEKEQHKQVLTKKECQVLNELDYVDTLKAYPSRSRKKYCGEQLQMDASSHDWFKNGTYAHLHAAIDDATGLVVEAYFDKEETLDAYYEVTEQFLTNYGIPYEILTDNRTVFIYKQEKHPSEEKDTFTQFGYACHTLGINLRTTSIPQAKGKIERLWNTLQDRLLQEMALCSIQSIDEANLFLKHYIPTYNAKFALQLKDSKSAFEKLPKTIICLCQVFLGRPITMLVWRSTFVHPSTTARLRRLLAHLFGERSKKTGTFSKQTGIIENF